MLRPFVAVPRFISARYYGRRPSLSLRRWKLLSSQLEQNPPLFHLRYLSATVETIEPSSYTELKHLSQEWLEKTRQLRWTNEDISIACYLLDQWAIDTQEDRLAAAKWATRVIKRWIQCEEVSVNAVESSLLIDNLHRILHMWRNLEELRDTSKTATSNTNEIFTISRQMSLDLYNRFFETALLLDNHSLRPGNKALSMVLSTIAKRPDLPDSFQTAQQLVQRLAQYESLDDTTKATFLHVLSLCHNRDQQVPELAEQILAEMDKPDAKCYSSVIRAWCGVHQVKAVELAEAWFDRCLDTDLLDNKTATITFNTILKAWYRLGESHRAERFLRTMIASITEKQAQFEGPNELSFLIIFNSWNKSRKKEAPQRASSLLDFMDAQCQSNRCQLLQGPSMDVYVAYLKTWSKQQNSGPRVEQLVRRLEDQYERIGEEYQRPTLQVYAEEINAWANTDSEDSPQRAEEIVKKLERLSRKGAGDLAPDKLIYTTLMQCWSKSGVVEAPHKVLSILQQMQNLALSGRKTAIPSVITYNVVMSTLVKYEEFDLAEDLIEMMKQGTTELTQYPDQITYATLIHGFSQSRSPEAPEKTLLLLREMETKADAGNKQLQPSLALYECVAKAQAGRPNGEGSEFAETILWNLQDRFDSGLCTVRPSLKLCNAVLSMWCDSAEAFAPERVESLFKRMQRESSAPDPNGQTFNIFLRTWGRSKRAGSFRRCNQLFQEMDDSQKSTSTFNQLFLGLKYVDARTRIVSGCALLEEMILLSGTRGKCAPDSRTLHYLSDLCKISREQDIQGAQQLITAVGEFVVAFENLQIPSQLEAEIHETGTFLRTDESAITPRMIS